MNFTVTTKKNLIVKSTTIKEESKYEENKQNMRNRPRKEQR